MVGGLGIAWPNTIKATTAKQNLIVRRTVGLGPMRIPSPHHGVRWGAGPGVKRYSGLDARSARAPSLKRLLILAWFRQDGCRGPSAAPGYARRPGPSWARDQRAEAAHQVDQG
jgi:hypothetical protein